MHGTFFMEKIKFLYLWLNCIGMFLIENGYNFSHIHSLLYNTQESPGFRASLPCTRRSCKVSDFPLLFHHRWLSIKEIKDTKAPPFQLAIFLFVTSIFPCGTKFPACFL